MATLRDTAKAYEPKSKIRNIAELPECPTDLEIEDDSFEMTDKATGKAKIVEQKVLNLNGEKYRVPISVLQQLKVILEDNPNLKKFKVKRYGSTKEDTKYQVIPLM